nr:calcium-binding protein [uncultured Moellerella sp.]
MTDIYKRQIIELKTTYFPARTTPGNSAVNINDNYIAIDKFSNFIESKYANGMTNDFRFFKENNYDEKLVTNYINQSKRKSLKMWLKNYLQSRGENKSLRDFKTELSKFFYTEEQCNYIYRNIDINGTYQDLKNIYEKYNITPPSKKEWLSFSHPIVWNIIDDPLMVANESSDLPLRGVINIEINQKTNNNDKFNIRIRLYEDGTSSEKTINDIVNALTETVNKFIEVFNIADNNNLFNTSEKSSDIKLVLFKNDKTMRNAYIKMFDGNVYDFVDGEFIANDNCIISYIKKDLSTIRHEMVHALNSMNYGFGKSNTLLLSEATSEYIALLTDGYQAANFVALIKDKYKNLTLEEIFNLSKKTEDGDMVYDTGTAIIAYIEARFPDLIDNLYNTPYIETEEDQDNFSIFFDNDTMKNLLELERQQIENGRGFIHWAAQNPAKKDLTPIIKGTTDDDKLFGGDGDDHISCLEGDDQLSGGKGNDKLYAGEGNDKLWGEEGDDLLRGGKGDDILIGGEGNDELYADEGNNQLCGGEGDDLLVGGEGDDILIGGEGNDELYAVKGNNKLWGGKDNDILVGGEGADILDGGQDDDELYAGKGNDKLWGGEGNDVLVGGEGDDELHGGKGNDKLLGGKGNDILVGGEGSDTYLFDENFGQDTLYSDGNKASDKDRLLFRQNITYRNLSLKQNGSDLQVIATSEDSTSIVSIHDFYRSDYNTIQEITADGHTLIGSDIKNLTDSMAIFNSTNKMSGESSQKELHAVIDNYWKPIITIQP